MKLLVCIVTLMILGCEYHQDKLMIKNTTSSDICFETLIKTSSGKYIQVSAGDKIHSNSSVNPITRTDIADELNSKSFDKILYLVFFDCTQNDYVNHNIDSLVIQKLFFVKKYNAKQLDSANWHVTYTGNNNLHF